MAKKKAAKRKTVKKKTAKRSTRSIKADRARRSKQPWERGKGAAKKGNPRYQKVRRRDKNGVMRDVYVLRKRK